MIFIPIWVPRDLSVRDASNTKNKTKKVRPIFILSISLLTAERSEFEAVGGEIEKTKEAKRMARNVPKILTEIRSTGSFSGIERRRRTGSVRFSVSCSFLCGKIPFHRRSLLILILICVPRDLSVRDASNTKKIRFALFFFTAETSEFEAVVG
jgi:hypothetical protein